MAILERVQMKFVKNVHGLRSTTYEGRLKELEMLDLTTRRQYLDLVETFKIIHGITRLNRSDIFEIVGDNPRRATRSTDCHLNIITGRCSLDIRRNFFSMRMAEPWNALPYDMKTCPSLSMFKSNLKNHLLNLYSD